MRKTSHHNVIDVRAVDDAGVECLNHDSHRLESKANLFETDFTSLAIGSLTPLVSSIVAQPYGLSANNQTVTLLRFIRGILPDLSTHSIAAHNVCMDNMTGETLCVDPEELVPPHPAHRNLRWLVADMVENGWQGRPLLVIDTGDEYVAWSGSQRISAAIEAGLEVVPCYVIPESAIVSATDGAVEAKNGHVMDYERLEILRRVGDEAGIEIMRREL